MTSVILWNNKDITIERKSFFFWKIRSEHGVYFVRDLLKNTGKYLSYEEVKTKYNIKVNFIYYSKIIAAIPGNLQLKAITITKPLKILADETDIYQLAEGKSIRLSKMRCKNYYSLFQEKSEIEPTVVKSWSKHCPSFVNN